MELEEDFDAQDPERLVQCPYDKHHQIRARRFPYHLVKCRKSHPEEAKQLATCPFNARHLVPQQHLGDHIVTCTDKGFVEQDILSQSCGSQREAVSTWQAPPCDEDWETELQKQSESPFIWGETNSDISRATSEQKNQLPTRVRAPKSSPFLQMPRKSSTEHPSGPLSRQRSKRSTRMCPGLGSSPPASTPQPEKLFL